MNWSTQEKDEAANQVCNDRSDQLAHRGKEDADTGKNRGTGLPPEQVECVPLEIDLHTGFFRPFEIKGLSRSSRAARGLYTPPTNTRKHT
jgi:hypothetical protein